MKIHIVKSGEDLSSICAKYQVDEESVLAKNPHAVELFQSGMKIVIPNGQKAKTTVQVEPEEAAYRNDESETEESFDGSISFETLDEQYDESNDWNEIEAEAEEEQEQKQVQGAEEAQDNASNENDFAPFLPPSFYELPKMDDLDLGDVRPPQHEQGAYPGLDQASNVNPIQHTTYTQPQGVSHFPYQNLNIPYYQPMDPFYYHPPQPYVPVFPLMEAVPPSNAPSAGYMPEPPGWLNWNPLNMPNIPQNSANQEDEAAVEEDEPFDETNSEAAPEAETEAHEKKQSAKPNKVKAAQRAKKRKKTLRIKRDPLDRPVKRKKSVPWLKNS